MGPLEVREARQEDLLALTDIYNHYVRTSPATFDLEAFSVSDRGAWFAQYDTTGPHRLLVAVRSGAPVGYASSGRFRPKPGYRPTVETTVYVHPDALGAGVGRALYGRLFDLLAAEGVHRACAAVTLPNDASVRLHEAFGFRRVGVFDQVGEKFGRFWDVLFLTRAL